MSKSKVMSAISRLKQDYLRLKSDPLPYITAEPVPSNILEWHYVIKGPEHSPYEGGYYHGKLIFPDDFPFKPPAIYMITPNGRFKTNTRLCLSISDFHPDQWNPSWSVSTILTGLLSFMLEKTPTMGALEMSDNSKRVFAYQSLQANLKHKTFCELFPDTVKEIQDILKLRKEEPQLSQLNYSENGHDDYTASLRQNAPFTLQSVLTNICVIFICIIFACVVKYVLKTELV